MKKLFTALAAFLIMGSVAIAQPDAKKDGKKAATKEMKSDAKMKKDGTPDMRYKENKEAPKAAVTGKMKKDGTADMRYKENKENKETKDVKDAKKK